MRKICLLSKNDEIKGWNAKACTNLGIKIVFSKTLFEDC